MAEITASMVKELRERTGAGMMDCKNALVEAGGDMAKATEVLQKKGQARAVKAAGKVAADGKVLARVKADGTEGVIVEVNSQTDFVARGEEFTSFANAVADQALASGVETLEALEALSHQGKTLREHAEALTIKSGEKHAIRRVARFKAGANGLVSSYIHFGDRLGVLVEVGGGKDADARRAFADEVALQIASMGPRYVRKDEVAADEVSKQREIFAAQMKTEDDETVAAFEDFKRRVAEEGGEVSDKVKEHLKNLEKKASTASNRPQAARDKILDGKVAKWLTEIVLLDQASVKEENKGKTVGDLVKASGIEVRRFARFELGEGVDKGPAKDFATEVAEMAAASQKG